MSYFDQLMKQAKANDAKKLGAGAGAGAGVTPTVGKTSKAGALTPAAPTGTNFSQLMKQARKNDNRRIAGTKFGYGNIDLTSRPVAHNDDGSLSTVDSRSYNIDGKEMLLSTVWSKDGKAYHSRSDEEIVQHYYDTGEYLGAFDTPEEADEYAQALHEAQEQRYVAPKKDGGATAKSAGAAVEDSGAEAKRRQLAALKEQLAAEKAKIAPNRTTKDGHGRKTTLSSDRAHRLGGDPTKRRELEEQIRAAERELRLAEQTEKANEFYSVWKDPDFQQTAKKGSAKKGNVVVSSRARQNPQGHRGRAGKDSHFVDVAYSNMTEDEVKTYNYLYETDEKKAKEYLAFIREDLNARQGKKEARLVRENSDAYGRVAGTIAYGAGAGLDQFGGGIAQFLSPERRDTSATQFGSAYIREDLADTGPVLPDWLGRASLGQAAYDAVTTTANMAPSILLSALTAGAGASAAAAQAAGTLSMGAGAAGNAYGQALEEGYSKAEARLYSTLIGASEAGLQSLFGGIAAFGGALAHLPKLATWVNNIDNSLLRVSTNLGLKMLSEGNEEYWQEILDPAFRNMVYGEQNDLALWTPEATYSFLLGALTAGLLDGASSVRSDIQVNRDGAQIKGAKYDNALIDAALKLDPETEAYSTAKQLKSGKLKNTTHNIGELFYQYARAEGDMNIFSAPATESAESVRTSESAAVADRLDEVTTALLNLDMGSGARMNLKTAKQKAGIISRCAEGGVVDAGDVRKLNLTLPAMRQVFEEFVGAKLPDDFNKLSATEQVAAVQNTVRTARESTTPAAEAGLPVAQAVSEGNFTPVVSESVQSTPEGFTAASAATQPSGAISYEEFAALARENEPSVSDEVARQVYAQYLAEANGEDATIMLDGVGHPMTYDEFEAFMQALSEDLGQPLPDDISLREMFDEKRAEQSVDTGAQTSYNKEESRTIKGETDNGREGKGQQADRTTEAGGRGESVSGENQGRAEGDDSGRGRSGTLRADESLPQGQKRVTDRHTAESWDSAFFMMENDAGPLSFADPPHMAEGEMSLGYSKKGKWVEVRSYPLTPEGLDAFNTDLAKSDGIFAPFEEKPAAPTAKEIAHQKEKEARRMKAAAEAKALHEKNLPTTERVIKRSDGREIRCDAVSADKVSARAARAARDAARVGYDLICSVGVLTDFDGTVIDGMTTNSEIVARADSALTECGDIADHEVWHAYVKADSALHFRVLDAIREAGKEDFFLKLCDVAERRWGDSYANEDLYVHRFLIEGEVLAEARAKNPALGEEMHELFGVVESVTTEWEQAWDAVEHETVEHREPDAVELAAAYAEHDGFSFDLGDDSTAYSLSPSPEGGRKQSRQNRKRAKSGKATDSRGAHFHRAEDEGRVFYTPRGVEVVQNPTTAEYRQMREEAYADFPQLRGTGEPVLRHTYDEAGNNYYWRADRGLHSQVEPYINRQYQTRTSQQWEWWKRPDKDDYPTDYSDLRYRAPDDTERIKPLQGQSGDDTMSATESALKDMSEEETTALLQYKSSESYKVNAKLRDGLLLTGEEQRMAADLDTALEKLPVHEGTVYRRLSFDLEGQEALNAFLAEHAEGNIVPYEAYTSGSTAVDGYPVNGKLAVTLVIESKTGRDVTGIGNNFESEVVFPRGRDFIVNRVTQDAQGNPVIYMKEDAGNGIGQLHSEERVQAVQQMQEKGEGRDNLHEVSKADTARGVGERNLPGVRGEGSEEVKFFREGMSESESAASQENRQTVDDFIRRFNEEHGEGAAEQLYQTVQELRRANARAERRLAAQRESRQAERSLAEQARRDDATAWLIYHKKTLRTIQREYRAKLDEAHRAKAEAVRSAVAETKAVERATADLRVEQQKAKDAMKLDDTILAERMNAKKQAAKRLRVKEDAYASEKQERRENDRLRRNAALSLLRDNRRVKERRAVIETAQGPIDTIRKNPKARTTLERVQGAADALRTLGRSGYRNFVNQALDIDRFAKRQKSGTLASTLVNIVGGASTTTETIYKRGLVDRSGNRIGESMSDVFLCWDEKGKRVDESKQALLQDYMLHKHNIDRMSFVERARTALESYEAENPWLAEMDAKELAKLAAMTDKEAQKLGKQEARDKAKRYAELLNEYSEARDKPVFPDQKGNAITAATSREVTAKYEADNPWLVEKAEGIYQWWDRFMRTWAVGDSLSEADYETMHAMYPHYVPTYRADKKALGAGNFIGMGGASVGSVVKKAKGGLSEIVNIEDSFANLANKAIRVARTNELYKNMIDTAMLDSEGLFSDMAVFDWDSMLLGRAYYAADGTEVRLDSGEARRAEAADALERAEKAGLVKTKDGYRVSAWYDGRLLSSFVSEDLFKSIQNTTGSAANDFEKSLLKVGNALTGPMKTAITGINPNFAIRNLTRDLPTAIINSVSGMAFPKYWAQAAKEIRTNSERWQQYQALGGTHATYYNDQQGFAKTMSQGDSLGAKVVGRMGAINEITEAQTRFAEYLATIDRLGDTYENRLLGIKNSAEVTVDFSRKGRYGKVINAWVPYWNPAVQGIDKVFRSVVDSPDGSAVWKQATKTLGRAAMTTVLAEALLYALLKGLDRYDDWEELTDRVKDTYYCIPTSDHKFIKIPKNREWGAILGTPLMRLLESANGRSDPFENYVETSLTPNFLPGTILGFNGERIESDVIGISQALDLAYNKDFAGRTIVPYAYQQGTATEQYDAETSMFSRKLGELLHFSPMQLDYIIEDYFGDFGDLFTMATAEATWSGDKTATDAIESVKDIFTDPWFADNRYSNQTVSDYYETLTSLEKLVQDRRNQLGEDAQNTLEYKTQKAMEKLYGKEIKELNRSVRNMPDGEEKDQVKSRIALLAGNALDFYKQSMNGGIAEPVLTAEYAELPSVLSDELIRLNGLSEDYAFKPGNYTPAKYNDPRKKGYEYQLDDEQKDKYRELYLQTYAKVMGEVIGKDRYKKANDLKKAEMLEEARDRVTEDTKETFLDWLHDNYRSTKKSK